MRFPYLSGLMKSRILVVASRVQCNILFAHAPGKVLELAQSL